MLAANVWLAAVPPCVGFAGWLFGGMDSQSLMGDLFICLIFNDLFDSFNRNS